MLKVIYVAIGIMFFASSANAQEVAVNCKEYEALTGDDYPCEHFETLKIKRSQYKTDVRNAKIGQCRAKAIENYGKEICYVVIRFYGVPKEFEGREDEINACNAAFNTCDQIDAPPPKKVEVITEWWEQKKQ